MNISVRKNLATALFFISSFFIFVGGVYAAPSFSFSPQNTTFIGAENFVVDVLIDTDGAEIVQAKAVVLFDPTYMQLVKAERNNNLFSQFPDDQQTTDNTNGVAMLTGFTQSGSGSLYSTTGEPEVFARLTFKPLWDGEVELDWNFTGDTGQFETHMVEDGSPPQNILNSRPLTGRYVLVNTGGSGKDGSGDDGSGDGNEVPATGIFDEKQFLPGIIGVVGGVMLFVGSGIYLTVSNKLKMRKFRTIVDVENKEESE